MTRIMRDSTSPADIPNVGTDIAAGYVNGKFAWTATQFKQFPVTATIDVLGTDHDADILDVETGDATVSQAVVWVKGKRIAHPNGYPPIIYCNRATLTPLFNALNANGLVVGKHFRLWIATLDGTKVVPDMTGVTAVQYAGQLQTHHHYDESIVYDNSWKAKTPPAVKTALLVQSDFTSRLVRSSDGVTWR